MISITTELHLNYFSLSLSLSLPFTAIPSMSIEENIIYFSPTLFSFPRLEEIDGSKDKEREVSSF